MFAISHCTRPCPRCSVLPGGRIKHYMIEQSPEGMYKVVGNEKQFGEYLRLCFIVSGRNTILSVHFVPRSAHRRLFAVARLQNL